MCLLQECRPVDLSESAKVKVLFLVDLGFPSTEAVSVFPSGYGRTSAMKRSALVGFDLPVVCSVNSDSLLRGCGGIVSTILLEECLGFLGLGGLKGTTEFMALNIKSCKESVVMGKYYAQKGNQFNIQLSKCTMLLVTLKPCLNGTKRFNNLWMPSKLVEIKKAQLQHDCIYSSSHLMSTQYT